MGGEMEGKAVRLALGITYELILLCCETLFILRLVSVARAWARIKKRYCSAPDEILPGHTVRTTRAQLMPALRRVRTELAAWCIIAAVTAYACVDCAVFWIGRK